MHTITSDPWTAPLRRGVAMKIYLPKWLHGRLVDVAAEATKSGLRLDGKRLSMSLVMRALILTGITQAEADRVSFIESINFDLTRSRDVETNLRLGGQLHRNLVRTAGWATVMTGRSVSAHCLILSMLASGLRTSDEVEWDRLMAAIEAKEEA